MADLEATVREGLLVFFDHIYADYGHSPTHVNMQLTWDNGARVLALCTPLDEGGTGEIIIKVKPGADWPPIQLG